MEFIYIRVGRAGLVPGGHGRVAAIPMKRVDLILLVRGVVVKLVCEVCGLYVMEWGTQG